MSRGGTPCAPTPSPPEPDARGALAGAAGQDALGAAARLDAGAWWVIALVPFLAGWSPTVALAWACALLVGQALAGRDPVRWVAVAWAASAVVPGASVAGVAGAGLVASSTATVSVAAAVGVALAVAAPPGARAGGPLFLLGALVLLVGGWLARRRAGAVAEDGPGQAREPSRPQEAGPPPAPGSAAGDRGAGGGA